MEHGVVVGLFASPGQTMAVQRDLRRIGLTDGFSKKEANELTAFLVTLR
jgi:hypothetical protein